MEFLHLVSKTIHIISGVLVLILGLLQMILPKRGNLHRSIGKGYFFFMVVIFFTSLPAAIYTGRWFLACVSVFALFLVWTGRRYALHKGETKSIYDKLITVMGFAASLLLILLSIMMFLKGAYAVTVIAAVFGGLLFINTIQDYRFYFKNRSSPANGKMHWHFMHQGRMIGSFIAAVTAFSVTIQLFRQMWINWTWPTVAGTAVIILFARHYRKKFGFRTNS